jgi:hypothetical protein
MGEVCGTDNSAHNACKLQSEDFKKRDNLRKVTVNEAITLRSILKK